MVTYDCPTCRTVIKVEQRDLAPHRPFCSRRCKLIDLGKWLDGTYRTSEPLSQSELEATIGDAEEHPDDPLRP